MDDDGWSMTEYSDLKLQVGAPAPLPTGVPSEQVLMSSWAGSIGEPLVSVVIHTYQHAHYIAAALDGVLIQRTRFPFEVIVHDDASTDGTREILLHYEARYPNLVKLILQSDNQFSKGRRPPEFSFPVARGKYIALCEGDDYWLDENKLQIQADLMEADSSCAVCGHDAFIVRDGVVASVSKLAGRPQRDFDSDRLKKGVFALTLSLMFVNRIQDVPFEQRQSLNGDKFMLSRLGAFGGYRYAKGIKPAAYRVHAGGVWSMLDEERKSAGRINTLFWLSRYYRRLGDSRMEAYFAGQITEQLHSGLLRIAYGDFWRMFRSLLRSLVRTRFPHVFKRLRGGLARRSG